jgi:hypothetical protein
MRELLDEIVISGRYPSNGIYLIGPFAPANGMGAAEIEVRHLA